MSEPENPTPTDNRAELEAALREARRLLQDAYDNGNEAVLDASWLADVEAALSSPPSDQERGLKEAPFQARVKPWMDACFGPEISADKLERCDRFMEEALELVQASDFPKERAYALIEYVYGRDQGEINQEVGGVMVTLAAHCLAFGVDMHEAGETELARIWTKVEQIRAKQAAKPTGSALPIAVQPPPVEHAAPQAEVEREAIEVATLLAEQECIYGDEDGPEHCGHCHGCLALRASGIIAKMLPALSPSSSTEEKIVAWLRSLANADLTPSILAFFGDPWGDDGQRLCGELADAIERGEAR